MYIEARDLVKTYKNRNAVDHVSIKMKTGEIVGLLGPNGAGKTTTFYMIIGIERPTSGEVFLDDKPIGNLPMHVRAQMGVSYLAQEASIFRKLTVEENLMAILEMTGAGKKECRQKMSDLLEEFHVAHVRERKGTELSGGESDWNVQHYAVTGHNGVDKTYSMAEPTNVMYQDEKLVKHAADLLDLTMDGAELTDEIVGETVQEW